MDKDPKCVEYSRSLEMIQRSKWINKYRKKPAKPRRPSPRWNIFGEDGKLEYPPGECIKAHDDKLKHELEEHEKMAKRLFENTISLKELRDKYQTDNSAKSRSRRKRMRQPTNEHLDEQSFYNKEADMPRSIDSQFEEIKKLFEKEMQSRILEPEQLEKIKALKTHCTFPTEPYDWNNLREIKKRISRELLKSENFRKNLKLIEKEIITEHKKSSRSFLINYLLSDPRQRKFLNISNVPMEWPTFIIRAPVPWHQMKVVATHFMEHNLFITNEISRAICSIWHERYASMKIVDLKEFGKFPIRGSEFFSQVERICQATKRRIIEEWFAEVAELFFERKDAWAGLFDKSSNASTHQVEKYFRSINALLSQQLRFIVLDTLRYFRDFIIQYSNGNSFEGEYNDFIFSRKPFITINVQSTRQNNELECQPTVSAMYNILSECFNTIMSITSSIPCIENMIFPELDKKSFLFPVNRSEQDVNEIINSALAIVTLNEEGPRLYLQKYIPYYYLLDGTDKDMIKYYLQSNPVLRDISSKIHEYDEIRMKMYLLRNKVRLNMIEIDCTDLNEHLRNILYELRTSICEHYLDKIRTINTDLCISFDYIAERIAGMPEVTRDVVELYNYLVESRDSTMFNLRVQLTQSVEFLLFLVQHQTFFKPEDIALTTRALNWPREMETMMELATTKLDMRKDFMEGLLKKRRLIFDSKIHEFSLKIDIFKRKDPPILSMSEIIAATNEIENLSDEMREIEKEGEAINIEESLLDLDISPYLTIASMSSIVNTFDQLWHGILDFNKNYDNWMYAPFRSLDATKIKEQTDSTWRMLYKLIRKLVDLPSAKRIAEISRTKVEKFRQFLPLLQSICNPGLQLRHWENISEVIGIDINLKPTSSLSDMIETGLHIHVTILEEISSGASKEHALEQNLKNMQEEWNSVAFELILYRETGVNVLSSVDDIQLLLDDQILKAQTMRGSPFIKAFEEEMQVWEEKLISMQDIIDQWIKCQATWMYLEPIFSSEDIMRQMPTEAKYFRNVDKIWRSIMSDVTNNPDVLIATGIPEMLEMFKTCNKFLEEIQKGLNDYLEKKRLFFPRFFFLSNDELLEILSETKDAQKVQPHLKKCFEGIKKLQFINENEIIGMMSEEEEYVPFSGKIYPVDAKGMVEKWLSQVEQLMKTSLKEIVQDSVIAYFDTIREEWIVSWPGQIVLCASQIHWTSEVCESFDTDSTKDYFKKCSGQIDKTVALVRGKLSAGSRITLNALIVIDVHARDVLKLLIEKKVKDVLDFNWIAQLRYYWFENNVIVSMITTDIDYGFEYLGNSPRLVITPLTDRCYRTLMGALKLNLGGAPEGPAGTGKTETAKDLAKAVAKQCVVFNCSEGLDYAAMGKFFKGLAQSGAWACFDEFNRIELEVLSVIAQQISSIQMAVAQHLEYFMFEGTELKLNPNCNVIITMNPGYAGRQELPDNLKVLFRTCAMMVPDYGMIGEITLYSYGFVDARPLAEKIVHTYKLCSEQLSSQSHYDYGMRAVKTVLVAAGNLKLKYPTQDESILVLRAIVDVNIPKFLAQDLPLFAGIYSDLFPGVNLPTPDRDELLELIKIELIKKNLQPTPWYLDKIIQIYEMILVRHGLMIVGDTLAGKTSAYQSLANALGELSTNRHAAIKEMRVTYRIINPKAITLGQMYGSFDPISHEWSDGVLANTFREFAQSTSLERKWIIFDGPVDAIWIENMNTVLDDNKKLCLMSGEIIQMSSKMNMIFEPADLEHASPATVSRCGMIYMEPSQLGWMTFFESYKVHLKNKLLPDQLELVCDIIEWLLDPIFYFIKTNCRTFITISELHMFLSFTKLLNTLLDKELQVSTLWLQCVLIFSIVWGICSTLVSDSKKLIDVFIRKILLGNDANYPKPKIFKLTKQQLFPERGTIFDWMYDKKNNGTWISWMDTAHQASLPSKAKLSDIIVQTNDMLMQNYFLSLYMENGISTLFVGPTGTGKSTVILNYMLSLSKNKYVQNTLNFSARTSANQTQDIVMSKLDRRRKGVYGPAMGKKCALFVDDLSMPMLETYGAQPPIELLRQWIDHGYWFNPKDTSKLYLVDILFLAAMLPPGGASNKITTRFTRHLSIIGIDAFDDTTMTKIFGTILEWHFEHDFDHNVSRIGKMMLSATIEVYRKAIASFLPIPSKSHYTFNLRDFSRVMGGILLVPSTRLKTPEKLIKLWIHEIYRVFHDRLVDVEDRECLFTMVKSACYENLRQPIDKILENLLIPGDNEITSKHMGNLLFGNYMDPDADPKIYDEISDFEILKERMDYYLMEFNNLSKTPMALVMFRYVIEHISRISRVLQQDNGHVLLIGVGGSGRTSCTRLATNMCEYMMYTIEITRSYGVTEWQNDLRSLLLRSGCDGKQTVFLFNDNQIKDESFLEDLSMLLNSGDVPNLYGSEEKAEILEKMANVAREAQVKNPIPEKQMETSPMALYGIFTERVRKNVHVTVGMSPIGDAFRVRLRMFPSLINCCTIDWFTSWPDEALQKVAKYFLQDLPINDEVKLNCVDVCQHFHLSVCKATEDYWKSQRRRIYATPTNYLELINCLNKLYNNKVEDVKKQQLRYVVGLEKLEFAAGQIFVMQEELQALQPKLVIQSQLSDKLMIKIEQDTVNVEAKKEVVAADEALANEAAAAAQAIKDDCESDLAEATPALEAALAALDTLKPADITIVKSMKNPPAGVRLVLEAVCIIKGVKPDRVLDSTTGSMIEDYWPPSVRLLGDIKFLESLKFFDKDNILPANMKKIRDKFIKDRGFQPEVIKKVSTACEGLCKWVRAMEVYDRVIKVVAPKKAILAEAEAELAVQMETLNAKRALLQEVSDKLQQLNDEFAECMREKKKLEDQIEQCVQKLDRAEKLIGGLGGEKSRWSEAAEILGASLKNVIGDILLASGIIAYLGAFTVFYRDSLINDWHTVCLKLDIPCSPPPFNLAEILGDPVEIRSWLISGLPSDKFSVENGIIIKIANRWPLMIDPQVQANKWIKKLEKENKLSVIKLTDSNYTRVIETAVQLGLPVLLENILEEIDSLLEPILLKNLFMQHGLHYIKFGENTIEYNMNFRLYITTRLRNPHYLPELTVKVNLLNFTLTPHGLQDQLLGIVVAKELPILEEKKNRLIIESANNKRILKEIEDKILQILSSSEGNILEDETAIKILSSSKILSEDIMAKQKIAAETSQDIDRARGGYKPVSHHATTLFFCISELTNIEPMYQYSLPWFLRLFSNIFSEKSQISMTATNYLEVRIATLNNIFTGSIYRNVCRSLFEKDKLIFSLILCVGILRGNNQLEEDLWSFLLTGGIAISNPYPNPASSWLSDKSWAELVRASSLNSLKKLKDLFIENIDDWKMYYDLQNPDENVMPIPFNELSEDNLERLVLLRCVRPDKLVPAIRSFIITKMGQSFTEPPSFELKDSYMDSNNVTPLIFILSPGSDPMTGLIKFAEDLGISAKHLKSISLGQGQGPVAIAAINESIKTGDWLVLQNCHLAESWMRELDRICDEVITPMNTHPKFRLWLTSYPSKAFPVAVLQNSVKMTNEPPKGLRSNLMRSYISDPISNPSFFNENNKLLEWRKLLFSLSIFHAIVQERRSFGPLGWNIPYEFNESDLRISLKQLQMFLNEYDDIPFEALLYLIGECNYGGRVTDDKDRRLLNSLLRKYFNPDVLHSEYSFSPSGIYHLPGDINYEGYISYIQSLPINQLPEVFGLHDNANITKDNRESMQLLFGALQTQTQLGGESESVQSNELVVFDLADEILKKMPEQFNTEYVEERFPVIYENSMNTILRQEVIRFNRLTEIIKSSLINLKKAIKGQIIMSSNLEEIFTSASIGRVPTVWEKKSYPTLKPLSSYIDDLLERIKFLQRWIDNDAPNVFWLSGFFFTQSFLTGVLQNYARKHTIPIDHLDFQFKITHYEHVHEIKDSPKYGVYVNGLFIEGARWNRKKMELDESFPKILFDTLPIIWLKPGIKANFVIENVYRSPLYKTSERRGVLATTGHSSNFVIFILLKTYLNESHWIDRGVACLCQLDD
ncbi:PREDICTED: dynein heavy chain 3, axonemal [Ceratosolen solmsi marchali]|uniref:Dynein heavy chain 3, axonemal n=1 Tax=Ceratosolen solmsi marchali TaxID=326594 RepID=A0AAJ7DZJ3_9HYME|nr:PREDICTED: dynein heavy chain 3, axonemal [Ceratosolen solmsi marchali]